MLGCPELNPDETQLLGPRIDRIEAREPLDALAWVKSTRTESLRHTPSI